MAEPGMVVRFTGDELAVRGVPIYELGDTFIALQRILHKAYLYERGRLIEGAPLRRVERQQLSLQIVDRERSSDLYVLAPFLADPFAQQMIAAAVGAGLETLLDYAKQRVVSTRSRSHSSEGPTMVEGSYFAGAIYAETVQITNHISNIGGIDSIELRPTGPVASRPVVMTEATQTYVRGLADHIVYGPEQQVVGYVTRLHPNRLMADIKVAPSHYVRVHMDEEMFDYVRYGTEQEETLAFRGKQIIKLGGTQARVTEFEADSVESLA